MATDSARPPVPPAAPDNYDEFSGVYGFFRRHQKKLLYTAGLFTLLTFSITGPMTDLVSELFGGPRGPAPKIVVNGQTCDVTLEDYDIGGQVARAHGVAIPGGVLPGIVPGEDGRHEMGEVLAILRRAAIAEGIQYSMAEVDRAIDSLREAFKAESPARLARSLNFPSLAGYRELMAEAMRIGLYIRLQTLALDTTNAEVLRLLLNDREKITLEVATFDEKAAEKQMKEAAPLTDDDLKAWFDTKTDRERAPMQVYDLPRAELRFCALLIAEGQFDPAQWADEALKDFALSDDQLTSYYEQEKETRFKAEDGTFKPFAEPAVKLEVTRLAQAEQVMNFLLGKLRPRLEESLKPLNEELARVQTELRAAEAMVNDLTQMVTSAENIVGERKRELEAKPDDADVKAQLQTAESALQAAKDEHFTQKEVVPAKQAALKVAQDTITTARGDFDFAAAMTELTAGKAGFVQKALTGLRNAEELKDLEANELGLGTWPLSTQGTALGQKGALAQVPGRTSKAIILYQATAAEPQPLKPWETLKPLLEGAYYTEKARTQGQDKKKLMEDALLRLAKERMPEKVTEIEGKRQARIDEKVAEWETKTKAAIADAETQLAKPGIGKLTRTSWQQNLDRQKAELANVEMRKKGFEGEVGRLIDSEIAEEAKQHYGTVLAAAAAEAGFTVRTIGPHPRDLQRLPRLEAHYDPTVVYLFRSQSDLKEKAATAMLQDFANRRWHVAVCTKVEPLTAADITRAEFESLRTGDGGQPFADTKARFAYQRAFTLPALEARYQLTRAVGKQRDLATGPTAN